MLIHRDALVVHHATTAQDTRYFLDGALIDKDGRTVATDGHTLARFTSNPPEADAPFPPLDGLDVAASADVIISARDLRAALTTIAKKTTDSQYLAIVPNGTHVTIATAKSDRTVLITSQKAEGQFPNYERVMTASKPVVAKVVLSAAYIERLGKMAKQVGAKAITLTLHGDSVDIQTQVFFEAKGENGTLDGAIMPMRA